MGKSIIIAAVADNGVIGSYGKLPWHIPEDLKRFKQLTSLNIVMMGRKTFDSLDNRPLPNRLNLVLTRNPQISSNPNLKFVSDPIKIIHEYVNDKRSLYVIGGAQVYEQMLPYVDALDITRVKGNYEGDTFFPVDWQLGFELVDSTDKGDYVLEEYWRI